MADFYSIIPMKKFRKTNKVSFYNVPMVDDMKAIDLVIHQELAYSPGKTNGIERPWYFHSYQIDNLFVAFGKRTVDLYKIGETDEIFTFEVTPFSIDRIYYDDKGKVKERKSLCDEPAVLRWETEVFHRVTTGEHGSSSVNLAVHLDGFDIKTNFNIYNLDTDKNEFEILRKGFKDQM